MLQTGKRSDCESRAPPPALCDLWQSPSAGSKHTGREAWAASPLAGMGEKLLLNILVLVGRKGLHLGSFQTIRAAFDAHQDLEEISSNRNQIVHIPFCVFGLKRSAPGGINNL